jgi:hypothetical protein
MPLGCVAVSPTYRATAPERIRVLEVQRFDPPRQVEVENDGQWRPAQQRAWRLCDDVRGWIAEVRWTELHDWGPGTYDTMVTPNRVRLPGYASVLRRFSAATVVLPSGVWSPGESRGASNVRTC